MSPHHAGDEAVQPPSVLLIVQPGGIKGAAEVQPQGALGAVFMLLPFMGMAAGVRKGFVRKMQTKPALPVQP